MPTDTIRQIRNLPARTDASRAANLPNPLRRSRMLIAYLAHAWPSFSLSTLTGLFERRRSGSAAAARLDCFAAAEYPPAELVLARSASPWYVVLRPCHSSFYVHVSSYQRPGMSKLVQRLKVRVALCC